MRKLFMFAAVTAALSAQTTTTVTLTGPSSVTPGNSFSATLAIAGTAGQGIVDLQWSLIVPPGFTIGTPTLSSSEPTGDVVQCGTAACLIWGSLTSIGDGTLATIPVSVAATTAPGTETISLSGIFAATSQGFNVNGLIAGPPLSIKVLSKCDLNGDGAVNVADVQLIVNAVLNGTSCPIGGACNVSSVAMEESVAAGATSCKL